MRFLFKFLVIFMTMVIALQSCRDSEEPPPPKDYKPYSSKDSALFCEILKSAYGTYLNRYCEVYHVRLDSIPTWTGGGCSWRWIEELGEKRIFELYLFDQDVPEGQFPGKVPPEIWELDCLRSIKVWGSNFHGEFPASNGKGNAVKYLTIRRTGLFKLPTDIFVLPNLERLEILFNKHLEKLPDELDTFLQEHKKNWSAYEIRGNALSGEIPVFFNKGMNLQDNNFTSINWDRWRQIDFEKDIRNYTSDYMCGPSVEGNRITGVVPDFIIADTFALFHTYYVTRSQQDGYGLSGFPPVDTIKKMRDEVLKRNPELKENLKFLIPNNL